MKKKKKAGICNLPSANQTPFTHLGCAPLLPQIQTLSSIAVSNRKAAKKRFGSFRGDGTANKNPPNSAHMKPMRIDIIPKKLASEKSIV